MQQGIKLHCMPSTLWLSHSHRWYSFSLGLSGATCYTHTDHINLSHARVAVVPKYHYM